MVVLDATIVNVALPHVQRALGFSGSGLKWVVNAYAVTFGGLLLLGGRAGDRLGRRRGVTGGGLAFSPARPGRRVPAPHRGGVGRRARAGVRAASARRAARGLV